MFEIIISSYGCIDLLASHYETKMNPTINQSIWFWMPKTTNNGYENWQTPTIKRLISQIPRAQTIKWVDYSKPKTKHRNDFAAGQERGGGGLWMNFQSPMLLFYRWECQSTRVSESKVSCWSLVYLEYMLLVLCALRSSLALSWSWYSVHALHLSRSYP